MVIVDKIETNKALADFNPLGTFDFERDGLGLWVGFQDEVNGCKLIVASPKHEIDMAGCSVFFEKATDAIHAGLVAKGLAEKYSLKDAQWITTTGMKLN